MISINEAYKIIKQHTDYPIESLYESNKHILGENAEYYLLNKESGELTIECEWLDLPNFDENMTPVYLQEMFDDFYEYYRIHNDEEHLAEEYAIAWKRYNYSCFSTSNEKSDANDSERVSSTWREIEKRLYMDIRNALDTGEYHYPPSVLDKLDDPFYCIKPFMLKNGYTIDIHNKLWVKDG